MTLVEVTMPLPYFLRLESSLELSYDDVCGDPPVTALLGRTVQIHFSRFEKVIDNSGLTHTRTAVNIRAETEAQLPEGEINRFAVRDCLSITNKVVTCYQATTAEVSNAGYISPLGTSDIQLFAEIRVDGKDFRDRWPFHDMNTSPLSTKEEGEFSGYLQGSDLPLPRLLLANARLLLNRGQYSLSVIQAAVAAEVHLTQYVAQKLRDADWPEEVIGEYEDQTLGRKLSFRGGDRRSLRTYLSDSELLGMLKNPLNRLRKEVVHNGYLATLDEAREAASIARRILKALSQMRATAIQECWS